MSCITCPQQSTLDSLQMSEFLEDVSMTDRVLLHNAFLALPAPSPPRNRPVDDSPLPNTSANFEERVMLEIQRIWARDKEVRSQLEESNNQQQTIMKELKELIHSRNGEIDRLTSRITKLEEEMHHMREQLNQQSTPQKPDIEQEVELSGNNSFDADLVTADVLLNAFSDVEEQGHLLQKKGGKSIASGVKKRENRKRKEVCSPFTAEQRRKKVKIVESDSTSKVRTKNIISVLSVKVLRCGTLLISGWLRRGK